MRFDTDPRIGRRGRIETQKSPSDARGIGYDAESSGLGFDVETSGPGFESETSSVTFDTGTTVVGLTAADGVVMAADKRMSLGGRFTANKDVRKVEPVHPRAAMAISGVVGPAQQLLQSLRAEASIYESRRGTLMTMTALSRTAGHLNRGLPVAPLLGGLDADGPAVYQLDGSGSVLADDYSAGGSGMQVAYGVLERRFDCEAEIEAASELARDAVAAASERDTASGNGVTIARITDDGVSITEPEGS